MLSTRTRYSIIALSDLAQAGGPGGSPVPLADIAERHQLPLCYLEQLAVRWRKAGLVKGVRGPAGGYVLKRPSSAISVADIAQIMDESGCCKDEGDEAERARHAGCPAQRILDLVTDQVQSSLAAISLADIVAAPVAAGSDLLPRVSGATMEERAS